VDLFDGQAIADGGWTMPDVAGIYDEPVDSEERLHRDVDAAWIVFTSALLSPLAGAAGVAIWDPRKNRRPGARRSCDFVQLG
jgi:hypothetical protein